MSVRNGSVREQIMQVGGRPLRVAIRPGTGKTRVLAATARARNGPVFGTVTSQNATNELRAAGVEVAANTTQLLPDLDRIPPGSLILADEGSMISEGGSRVDVLFVVGVA